MLLLPLGATEAHGPHGPLATDPIISRGLCRRVARALAHDHELRAAVLPSIDYGVTRYASGFAGTIHISEETLHSLLVDVCVALINQGLRYIMLVNSHFEPEHVRTLHQAVDTVQARTSVQVGLMDLTRKFRADRLTEEFRALGAHAGRYETSLVLAERPDLIDRELLARLPSVRISLVAEILKGLKDFKEMGLLQAYNGDPSKATAEEGQATYEVLSEMLISLMRELVTGEGGRDAPGAFNRL